TLRRDHTHAFAPRRPDVSHGAVGLCPTSEGAMKAIGAPETPNVRMLAQEYRESQTGVTASMTLTYTPLQTLDGQGLELVFVDGDFLQPGDYAISGKVITFDTPLAGTETVTVRYPYSTAS